MVLYNRIICFQTVSEVKCMAVSKFCMSDIIDGGRLRHDHETLGLRSPSK